MAELIQKKDPFNRPPRQQLSFQPLDIDIPAPPTAVDDSLRSFLITLLPTASFLVMGVFYGLVYAVNGSGGISSLLLTVPMIFMGLFTVVTSLMIYGDQKHQQKIRHIKQMRDYHRLLDKKEARLLAAETLQRHILNIVFQTRYQRTKCRASISVCGREGQKM